MNVRMYAAVTAAYWAFTITDGALRMLVLLYFHELGYSPVTLGLLFLLYEFFGVVTNLVGGWIGSRHGLNKTLFAGLAVQVVALLALSLQDPGWVEVLSVAYVMGAQALSGIAKDLTKMSAKSAIKLVVGGADEAATRSALFRWVAVLTGSKNALKGVGFFVGGALLASVGFERALWLMAGVIALVLVAVVILVREEIGRSATPQPLRRIFSSSPAVNRLSAARLFLFGARDLWFVVALPLFLGDELGWSFEGIGAFLAAWVIGYGVVQSSAPRLLRRSRGDEVQAARTWALVLGLVAAVIAVALAVDAYEEPVVVGGLIVFGLVFAVNSSVHSYLILAYSASDEVALDVGFYYSANAAGRLVGTLLSGVVYLLGGLTAALWASTGFIAVAWLLSLLLPPLAAIGADDDADGPNDAAVGTGSA
ncbi:MAG: organoarsenical effux MFS transporter ArsJ [Actinomycetota bacterium]